MKVGGRPFAEKETCEKVAATSSFWRFAHWLVLIPELSLVFKFCTLQFKSFDPLIKYFVSKYPWQWFSHATCLGAKTFR